MTLWAENGILLIPNFLPLEMCLQLRQEMRSAHSQQAGLYDRGDDWPDDYIRKTKTTHVTRQGVFFVTYQLMDFKPVLEQFYQDEWLGCHLPQFLLYTPGDFFQRHGDVVVRPQQITDVRKLTVLLFLNAPNSDDEPFVGGDLLFFDLKDQHAQPLPPQALPIQTGLLVAFKPHLQHEVTQIKAGIRYSVVTWFYG